MSLIERVEFDMPCEVADGYGGTEEGWSNSEYQCRASFTYPKGGESVVAGRLMGVQPIVARIRRSDDADRIATGWRMRCGEMAYNVRSRIPTNDRLYLELLCESGVAV